MRPHLAHLSRFAAVANPASQEKLFARSGHTWAEVMALADAANAVADKAENTADKAEAAAEEAKK